MGFHQFLMISHAVWSRNARVLGSKLTVRPGWQEPTENACLAKDFTLLGVQKAVFFPPPAAPYRDLSIHYISICVCVRLSVCPSQRENALGRPCPGGPRAGPGGVKNPTFGLTSMDPNPTRIRLFRRPNRAKMLFSAVWTCFYHGF